MKLSANDVTIAFQDGEANRTILSDVSIGFDQSAVSVVMGPSGSGKSSLLFVLSSLRDPTSGQVMLDDNVISQNKRSYQIRYEKFGFIFQQHFLIPYMSVLDNVCIARKDLDLKPKALEVLDALGIGPLAHSMPYHLSGGERQRVAIARALVKDPCVVFADEPTASLDKDNALSIYSVLRQATKNCILIMATHDPELLHGDERIIRIDETRLVESC